MTLTLAQKTVVITGASRGIGRAIALRCARDGANLVLAAKTTDDSQQKLKGTIHDVAREVEEAGGKALALMVDVREPELVTQMAKQAAERFGGIDALVNNAGAIMLQPVEQLSMKRFDLLWQVNVRAAYACAQACAPYLKQSTNGHVINMSPPISLDPKWLGGQTGYTITKYGMSLLTMGLAKELEDVGVAVNSLWPRTLIATAAVDWIGGEAAMRAARKPEIMADAAYALLTTPSRELTGKHLLDEELLRSRGVTDFDAYAFEPGAELMKDFYVD